MIKNFIRSNRLSIFTNNKKEQYSEKNIEYSNKLQNYKGKRRSSEEVNKMLNDWQVKLHNKPIEVEQKYYYSDKRLNIEDKVVIKKQEKIEI